VRIRLTNGITVITVHCIFTIWVEMPLQRTLRWMHWVLFLRQVDQDEEDSLGQRFLEALSAALPSIRSLTYLDLVILIDSLFSTSTPTLASRRGGQG